MLMAFPTVTALLRAARASLPLALAACTYTGGVPAPNDNWPAAADPPVDYSTPAFAIAADPPLGLDALMVIPDGNPITAAKVELGRALFFDPQLSADGTVSCASCHRPEFAFADDASVSPGVYGRLGTRNTPSALNAAYGRHFLWDGRSTTLEDQVLLPIEHEAEMGSALSEVIVRLAADSGHRARFERAFGAAPSAERMSHALASYLRTLRSGNSAADRFRAGDTTALTAEARRGFRLFVGKAQCATCHGGAMMSDQGFHNTGVAWRNGRLADAGRALVTGAAADSGAFKTPSLRNVALTAPYMHDGSMQTLEEVLAFYGRGGVPNPHLSPEIIPLRLSAGDRADLLAFLRSLTSSP
jgi:cytochrome c peroxidase